jgi:hypothetical protein
MINQSLQIKWYNTIDRMINESLQIKRIQKLWQVDNIVYSIL